MSLYRLYARAQGLRMNPKKKYSFQMLAICSGVLYCSL